MIDIKKLTAKDVGRNVVYHRTHGNHEVGKLSSWNDHYIFIRFKGPNGQACRPENVSFQIGTTDHHEMPNNLTIEDTQ